MKTIVWICILAWASVLCFLSLRAGAQCSVVTPAPEPSCGATGETALSANNVTIGSGSVYYYGSAGGSYSKLDMNKGTLLVCGSLTLTQPNISSGTIVVEPGATLTIQDNGSSTALQTRIINYGTLVVDAATPTTNIAVNDTIWNYGTMNVSGSLTVNAYPFYNAASTSVMTVSGSFTTYDPMVNNGNMQIGNTYTFTSSVCLGGGSDFTVPNLADDGSGDEVTVQPSPTVAKAGFTISSSFNSNWNALSSSSSLVLCEAPGFPTYTQPGPSNYGSATIESNCTSIVLPVVLVSFSAQTGTEGTCTIEWNTAMETGVKDFDLEYSLDGSNFVSLTTQDARNEPSSYTYSTLLNGQTWFRLRINNSDGTFNYSQVIQADYNQGTASSIRIQPNLITGSTVRVWTQMAKPQAGTWVVVDMMGRTLFHEPVQLGTGAGNTDLLLPSLAPGVYRLLLEGGNTTFKPVPFSVIR